MEYTNSACCECSCCISSIFHNYGFPWAGQWLGNAPSVCSMKQMLELFCSEWSRGYQAAVMSLSSSPNAQVYRDHASKLCNLVVCTVCTQHIWYASDVSSTSGFAPPIREGFCFACHNYSAFYNLIGVCKSPNSC